MTQGEGDLPLAGVTVVDFSQFLSGPSAALRLADLGARVIKVERPGTGDICRSLYTSNLRWDGDSTLFHAINRNKEGYAVDLRADGGLQRALRLVARADVLIENFRPGVMARLGLGAERLRALQPGLIYASITGYGGTGPWRDDPGQDLLVQSLSGLAWLNGDAGQPPTPLGLSVVDMMAGAQLVQGILGALVRRGVSGVGARVEVSLLEAVLDMQFELFTTHLNDGGALPVRSRVRGANAYLGAPYGIYETADGYLALAMGSVADLARLLACPALQAYPEPFQWSEQRDEIKEILVRHLRTCPTARWLEALEPAGYWCAEVLTWTELLRHEGFQALRMLQEVERQGGRRFWTTRCPIRIDGRRLTSERGSPRVGQDTEAIDWEWGT